MYAVCVIFGVLLAVECVFVTLLGVFVVWCIYWSCFFSICGRVSWAGWVGLAGCWI